MPIINQSTTDQPTIHSDTPDSLKPYLTHGVILTPLGKERIGDCPLCTREGKFSVNVETGQWRCFACGGGRESGGGGPVTFIELFWKACDKATTSADYGPLALDRGLEFPDTLAHWGVAKNLLTGHWIVPGWGPDLKGALEFQQLYTYKRINDRMMLLPTYGRKHVLLGMNLYNEACSDVYVCEGPWDGMRLWETMRTVKSIEDDKFGLTANVETSMLAGASVVASPSCSAFPDTVSKYFKGRVTYFLYDSDYPCVNKTTGEPQESAGYAGTKRHIAKLGKAPSDVYYVKWGNEGFDPSLPDGYDVKDCLKESKTAGLTRLLNRLTLVPPEWREGRDPASGTDIGCRTCTDWKTLVSAWRKAMKWTPGLDHALASMLASVASTNAVGDQLWLKIIGPASCGKSTLCEAVSINKRFVVAKSTIRGFHSGYKTDNADSNEDNSLIPSIKGKTLVTKDGDTLLQSPNLGQILSEARDLYDSVSRTHYRNKMSKDYEGIRMTWLLCGTSSLRAIDSSELGERFLDCVIMERIDEELEDEILWRAANQAVDQIDIDASGEANTHHSPERILAYELTGGYVTWLRENAARVLPTIGFSDPMKRECISIAKFVAFMRARPSKIQAEQAERELAARLVSQHIRYAKCLSMVMNRSEVDPVIMQRTRQIGLNTARGVTLRIVSELYRAGASGLERKAIEHHANKPSAEVATLIRFMAEIGIIEAVNQPTRKALRLTKGLRSLYERAHNMSPYRPEA